MTLDPAPRRRTIACVYCAGEHTSTAEVRECWQRSDGEAVADVAVADVADVAEPPHSAADQVVHLRRGPTALGRNVIVTPGMSTPNEWSGAERVVIDPSDPGLLPRLVALAMERTGCVFEFAPTTVLGEPFATQVPPHAVGPRVRFSSEQLRHLVLSNSVDTREGGTWPLLQQSLAVGARVVADARGDIELPDGSRAWLDGGPPRFTDPQDGVPVLHRIAVEHGRLAPPLGNGAGQRYLRGE